MNNAANTGHKQFTIRFTVVSIVALATLVTAAIAIGLQYYFSAAMAREAALKSYRHTASATGTYLSQVDTQAINTAKLLAHSNRLSHISELTPDTRQTLAELMRSNALFYAIYAGFGNGDFFELVNLEASPVIRGQLRAAPTDRWVVISVTGTAPQRERHYRYFNDAFTLRHERIEASDYDSSLRPWYLNARDHAVHKSEPYLFQHLQAPGQTYSIKIPDTQTVLAVDIALSSLSEYLQTQGLDDNGQADSEIYLYRQSGEVIASNQVAAAQQVIPPSRALKLTAAQQALVARTGVLKVSNESNWAPIDFAVAGAPRGYSIDLLNLVGEMTGLELSYVNGFDWPELVELYRHGDIDVLQPLLNTEANQTLGVLSDTFIDLPFALVTQPGVAPIEHIGALGGKTLAVPAGWSIIDTVRQAFPQITLLEVASTKAVLDAVANGEAFAGLDNHVVLQYTAQQFFIDTLQFHTAIAFTPAQAPSSFHYAFKTPAQPLVALFNAALRNISPAQHTALHNKWFGTHAAGQAGQRPSTVPYPALIQLAQDPQHEQTLSPQIINGVRHFVYVTPIHRTASGSDYLAIVIPEHTVLAPSMHRVTMSILITGAFLLLVFPLSWLLARPIITPIKLLEAENDKIKNRRYRELVPVDTRIAEIKDLADSINEMAVAIEQHEQNQKQLLDAFIKIIAQAIDDKSPYTANHCNRVPVLGMMLAEAVSQSDSAAFSAFAFNSDDERREFNTAAWLHDCGKITTPEHIVDKGTKLETIYNRIHEIRTRFEVLWRDAELHYYQQLIDTPNKAGQHQAELSRQHQRLQDDFAFIANANVGGEFMDAADVERLQQLAGITWQRHFDDRLGLSPVEELNLSTSTAELPATEPLLSDKPEHIIKRHRHLELDPKFKINMDIPEHLYNLGELYNLSISRGTLTREDRFKINEHMTSTIKMLDSLPFPPELARVPRYASTHHETLKGTGYPRKLSAEDLSIPERILVIADIFEALTAADRPYKKAKPVSVAIDILYKMALDDHVDIELFRFFLSSGVYQQYAYQFLDAAQIDTVDVGRYLYAAS